MMDYKNTIGTILSFMVQCSDKLVVCTKRNKVWVIWYQGDVESGLRSWLGRDCDGPSLALVVGEHGHLELYCTVLYCTVLYCTVTGPA